MRNKVEEVFRFDHEEGLVSISLDHSNNALILGVDGEFYCSNTDLGAYNKNTVKRVARYMAQSWRDNQIELDEIDYIIQNLLEYKLREQPN